MMAADSVGAQRLQTKTRELKTGIAGLGDMFPGSLVQRFRKCGKPNCHCAKKSSQGHGPTWVVTREVAGRTVSKIIPDRAVEQVRSETEQYRRFRELSRELIQTSAELGDIRLQQAAHETEGKDQPLKKNRARRKPRR